MSDSKSEGLTFKDKYNECKTWQDKSICIALYHTAMMIKYPTWTITDTSLYFEVSIGLVSENVRLAKEIDSGNKKIVSAKTREEGLKMIERRNYSRYRLTHIMYKFEDKDEE